MKKKCYIYARCASRMQRLDEGSISEQLSAMDKFAKKEKLEIAGVFTEYGTGRRNLKKIVKKINSGEKLKVVCMDIDRLGRHYSQEMLQVLDAIKRGDIEIVTPYGKYKKLTSEEQFISSFLDVSANFERRKMGEYIRRGRLSAKMRRAASR